MTTITFTSALIHSILSKSLRRGQGFAGEIAADAFALELGLDFGVRQHDAVAQHVVFDPPGELAAVEGFEPVVIGAVLERERGTVGHAQRSGAVREASNSTKLRLTSRPDQPKVVLPLWAAQPS